MIQTNIDCFYLTIKIEIFKLKYKVMKKFLKRISCLIFIALSLICGAGVFVRNANEITNDVASAVYYETDHTYLYDLFHDGKTLESSYNLTKRYPLIQENQTDTDLCWIYTSLKSLESAFMVQTGEYYNFSEVGQEYLHYAYQVENNYFNPTFDYGGNFSTFVESYQNSGLILESDFSNKEKDLMLMAIMLHDGMERGITGSRNVLFEHPILISEYIRHTNVGLTLEDRDFICSMVECHSGINNKNEDNDRTLPLPQSKYQKFVYMCIIMANMKFMDIKFNGNNEIVD